MAGERAPWRDVAMTNASETQAVPWVDDLRLRPPVAIAPNAPLDQAARIMRARDVSALVVGEPGELVSILTERDLTQALADDRPPDTGVGTIASPDPLVDAGRQPRFERVESGRAGFDEWHSGADGAAHTLLERGGPGGDPAAHEKGDIRVTCQRALSRVDHAPAGEAVAVVIVAAVDVVTRCLQRVDARRTGHTAGRMSRGAVC